VVKKEEKGMSNSPTTTTTNLPTIVINNISELIYRIMKIYPPLSLAFLIPTASAWTTPTLHTSPIRSIALQQQLPTLLRSTPVKDAIEEEVVVNGATTKPSEKEFGVVSSDKLNELYDLVVIGGVSSFV